MRYLLFFFLLTSVSCAQESKTKLVSESRELVFKADSLNRESCVGESCAKLRLVWPVASGSAVADKVNAAISGQLALMVGVGEEVAPLDTLIEDYFESFQSFKKEFTDSPGAWEIEAEGEVVYRSDSTLGVYFSQFSFLGGAHPNSFVSFLHFDPKSGDTLSDDKLVLDEIALTSLAEKKFREYHEVAEGVSLEEDGRFFLPETGFFLANAKGFKDGKFLIIYVPYEIGPYVMGYTELEFTKEEVGDLVRW